MHAPRTLLAVLACLALAASCKSRERGDDDDGGSGGDGDADGDGGGDPCPDLFCCPGKDCPGGFLCTPQNTCVSDPCGGMSCCEQRPCEDAALECVNGACVPLATVGLPCVSDADCSGPEAQCLLATQNYPDGYCIQDCLEGDVCPGDGVCIGSSCFDGCFIPADCRIGYDCVERVGALVCSPL